MACLSVGMLYMLLWHEKKVKGALEERIELHGVQDLFGDVLVPTEEVVEMRAGQKRKSEASSFLLMFLCNGIK